jgi:predicted transcriptional regulator
MTRTDTLQFLLEYGPLTFPQIQKVTGWERTICNRALQRLKGWGSVVKTGHRRSFVYALKSSGTTDGSTHGTRNMPITPMSEQGSSCHG